MIILITGTPGSGKTLFTVAELLVKQFADRPLYVNNIPNLIVPHEVVSGGENPEPDDDVFHWYDGRIPKNAVLVIDEAQRVFRPRSSTSAVPEYVAKLETHRHLGIDIVLITQHPQLIDANVRRLVGRHIHVRRAWGRAGASIYEWDSVSMNVQAVKQAQFRFWPYDKKAYQLYKSSELHTKTGQKLPWAIKLAMIAVVAVPLVMFTSGKHLFLKYSGTGAEMESKKEGINQLNVAPTEPAEKKPMTPEEYRQQFEPRVLNVKHSAPRYDELTQPVRLPIVIGCMQMKDKCLCYTQDGTPYKVTKSQCTYIVENGTFYDFLNGPYEQRNAATLSDARRPGGPEPR